MLAIFRLVLGLAILADLGRWALDFTFFFTSRGPLTLSGMVADTGVGEFAFSLYNACTYPVAPYLLFAATVIAAVAVTAGWHCQISTPCLWLLLVSLQNRAAVALDQGDRVLLIGLSLGLLLPWDRAFRWGGEPAPKQAKWVGAVGLLAVLISLGSFLPQDRQPQVLNRAASFLALGPRYQTVSDTWYVVVGVDEQENLWDLTRPDRAPPSFAKGDPRLEDSYRKRLYLSGLRDPKNWGLRYWLAFRYFLDQQRGSGKDHLRRVEVYQCSQVGHNVFARWPMQDALK